MPEINISIGKTGYITKSGSEIIDIKKVDYKASPARALELLETAVKRAAMYCEGGTLYIETEYTSIETNLLNYDSFTHKLKKYIYNVQAQLEFCNVSDIRISTISPAKCTEVLRNYEEIKDIISVKGTAKVDKVFNATFKASSILDELGDIEEEEDF